MTDWTNDLKEGDKVDYFLQNTVWVEMTIRKIKDNELTLEYQNKPILANKNDIGLARHRMYTGKILKTESEMEEEYKDILKDLKCPYYNFPLMKDLRLYDIDKFIDSLTVYPGDCSKDVMDMAKQTLEKLSIDKERVKELLDSFKTYTDGVDPLQLIVTTNQEKYESYYREMKISSDDGGKLNHKFVTFYSNIRVKVPKGCSSYSCYLKLGEDTIAKGYYDIVTESFFFPDINNVMRRDDLRVAVCKPNYNAHFDGPSISYPITCKATICSLNTTIKLMKMTYGINYYNIKSSEYFVMINDSDKSSQTISYKKLGFDPYQPYLFT